MNQKILLNAGSSGVFGGHSTEMAMRCLRLYALATLPKLYELGYGVAPKTKLPAFVEEEKKALVRGSIGHVGMAHRYARMWATQNKEDPELFYTPIEAMKLVAPTFGRLGEELLPKVLSAVKLYETYYAREKFEILHVEEVFSLDFTFDESIPSNLAQHTQRADLVVRERDGKIYIIDHKFNGRLTKDTMDQYVLDIQFIGYYVIGRKTWGKEFGGVKANCIGCDDQKFDRDLVAPAPESVRTFEIGIEEARRRVAYWMKRDPTGKDWPKANSNIICMNKYGACPAYARCQWG